MKPPASGAHAPPLVFCSSSGQLRPHPAPPGRSREPRADSLDAYARTAERFLAEEDPWAGFCGFLESALELHAENVALKDVLASGDHGAEGVEAARERLRPIVARLISRAQEAGALRADFTPRDV